MHRMNEWMKKKTNKKIESSQQKWIQTESVDDDDDGNKNGKETINI